jgi:hypothetical protein
MNFDAGTNGSIQDRFLSFPAILQAKIGLPFFIPTIPIRPAFLNLAHEPSFLKTRPSRRPTGIVAL